jgi:hypothetical protein
MRVITEPPASKADGITFLEGDIFEQAIQSVTGWKAP